MTARVLSGLELGRNPMRVLALGGALVALAFFLLPIAYLLSVSFKRKDDVLAGNFLPVDPTLDNWPGAFAATSLTTFIANSVIVSVLAGVLTIAITLPAAYAMIRMGVFRRFLPQATLASYIAPPVVGLASRESDDFTGRIVESGGGLLAIAEGWHRGPVGEPNADPSKLGPTMMDLQKRARLNAGMNGKDLD